MKPKKQWSGFEPHKAKRENNVIKGLNPSLMILAGPWPTDQELSALNAMKLGPGDRVHSRRAPHKQNQRRDHHHSDFHLSRGVKELNVDKMAKQSM